jgi:hypothetical protein
VVKEVREALPALLLFLFLFHMVALTKTVALGGHGITALRATTATVGALVVAKAILLVEALAISRLFASTLVVRVVWKTLLFGAVALLFLLVEDVIELASKHGGLAAATKVMFRDISWPFFWVSALWVLGGLLLYSLAAELARAVDPAKRRALFFGTGDG